MQYDLIKILLSINKITIPNVHACVSYFITIMKSPSVCHKNDLLQLDVTSIKELQLLVLSSKEEHRVHLKTLLSKHINHLLKIYQQIIQSGRFKKAYFTLERVMNSMTKWFNSNLDLISTIYKLIHEVVKTFIDQYYTTHHKSILLNTVIDNNIYDNYNYTSCMNWKIEKSSETP